MNLPNFPTDNLYKFLALSGFVLALLSFGYLIHREELDSRAGAEIRVGREAIEYSMDDWERRAKIVASETEDELGKLTANNAETSTSKAATDRVLRETRSKLNLIQTEADAELTNKIVELRRKSELADAYQATTSRLTLPLWLAGILGLIMSMVGFVFWYVRLQRLQDQIIRSEALRAVSDSGDGSSEADQ